MLRRASRCRHLLRRLPRRRPAGGGGATRAWRTVRPGAQPRSTAPVLHASIRVVRVARHLKDVLRYKQSKGRGCSRPYVRAAGGLHDVTRAGTRLVQCSDLCTGPYAHAWAGTGLCIVQP
jgi:hypothetical protein